MSRTVNITLFASGRGSNARSILQACADGQLDAKGVLVLSNNADAGVHQVAQEFGVTSVTISRDQFKDGPSFVSQLLSELAAVETDLICLAGYMRMIPSGLIRAYPQSILNIHPALLPKFGGKGMYGLNVHKAVIEASEKESGVTVHYVNEKYDEGDILLQRGGVPVLPDDTPETLGARVLDLEHRLYPEAVGKWIDQHHARSLSF
ncbi:phosphoribosylglycinamide formyltransferase [bacterium BMS3Bbin04]|nr:phosphoribosylglycinamide formyltransferase [bacterium BMS3Bbin04]